MPRLENTPGGGAIHFSFMSIPYFFPLLFDFFRGFARFLATGNAIAS
jgi:hypothetical protein